jgi:hypothetical protein
MMMMMIALELIATGVFAIQSIEKIQLLYVQALVKLSSNSGRDNINDGKSTNEYSA